MADKVSQVALKLVLEPIFEADFEPASYGFRPLRRAHDAIAEIHHFGNSGYDLARNKGGRWESGSSRRVGPWMTEGRTRS